MKKLLSISLLVCLAFFANAQDITASYNGSAVNMGDTLTAKATGDELQFAPHFSNNGAMDICCRLQFDRLNETQTVCTSVCTGALCMTGGVSAPFVIARFSDYTDAHAEFYVPEDAPATLFKVTCYDTANTSSKVEFYLKVLNANASVGIHQAVCDMQINAFPNPASNVVTVSFSEAADNGEVVLYNISGMIVKKVAVNAGQNVATISVSDLSSGVYFYGVRTKDGMSAIKKLVVR